MSDVQMPLRRALVDEKADELVASYAMWRLLVVKLSKRIYNRDLTDLQGVEHTAKEERDLMAKALHHAEMR